MTPDTSDEIDDADGTGGADGGANPGADAGDAVPIDPGDDADLASEIEALRADLDRLRADVDALADRSVSDDDVSGVRDAVRSVRGDLDDLREHVDERTVRREDFEAELRRYVRKRVRRGHATGWGPYLVLLYGTVMTVAAYYYLGDPWAILAMLVVWLSTLGLYVFMVVVGTAVGAGRRLAGLRGVVEKFR
jgi:hypothetical protein